MTERFAELIEDRSARGIAVTVSRLITDGTLRPGERLPTVRALARRLGVSPTTVSEAWQVLGSARAIDSRGRLGTFVVGPATHLAPRRYRSISEGPGHYALDLSSGTPDPELLPDLTTALSRVSTRRLTTSYLDDPVLPELARAVHGIWPFTPAAITVVDGAMDALDRLIHLVARLGDRVVVEQATFPPMLDLLEQLGVEVIGVDTDGEGIVPESLARALARKPVALITQPRAHNPLSISATPERIGQLAEVLHGTETLVIEDDHAGDIALTPLASMGVHRPDHTVLIRSFSKSHGPDLRLAAVGGASDLIDRMVTRRMLGPGWSSRLLQAVLAELLESPQTASELALARDTYAKRRGALVEALAVRGVPAAGDDGINVWVQVADERTAQVVLAARGVGVAPGAPFMVDPTRADHLRLTISSIRDDIEGLADLIAVAAEPPNGAKSRRRA